MDETVFIEKLQLFGLTRQEAVIYFCLYQNGDLTGYEAAKKTGISRSNVYSALSGLVDKGAAYVIEGASSKYVAVDIQELCDNKVHEMFLAKEFLVKNMPQITAYCDGYITIEGHQHILDKIHHMILQADQRIYISAAGFQMQYMKADILDALQRGIKVVVLTDEEKLEQELAGIILYQKEIEEAARYQIRIIVDSLYVLTGDMPNDGSDTCLYSGQTNFVNVFKEALRNEIQLIQLKRETFI